MCRISLFKKPQWAIILMYCMNLYRGIKNRFTSDTIITYWFFCKTILSCHVWYITKNFFFNLTGSPLDPNKILEYKPLPFEEILLQRRRKKSCKNWPNPKSCDVLIYTRSLFTLHLTACSWWWKKKGMYSLTKMYIKIFFH